MSVGDEPGAQPVFGKLAPEDVGVARQCRRDSVAEVGTERGACLDGRGDLVRIGVGVADGDHDAESCEGTYAGGCGVVVRGDGDEADGAGL